MILKNKIEYVCLDVELKNNKFISIDVDFNNTTGKIMFIGREDEV